mgnify:CR=1 FL=1
MANLLIVDDEENIRLLYKEVLEEDGHKAEIAKDGEEALARIERGGIDLVILDIRMPGIDGIEVLRRMHEKNKNLKVILNSAYAGYEEDVHSWFSDAYIIKSGDLTELRNKVKEILAA